MVQARKAQILQAPTFVATDSITFQAPSVTKSILKTTLSSLEALRSILSNHDLLEIQRG